MLNLHLRKSVVGNGSDSKCNGQLVQMRFVRVKILIFVGRFQPEIEKLKKGLLKIERFSHMQVLFLRIVSHLCI